MIEKPGAVLFACTMNAIRSPMAEGIARSMYGRQIYVDSAGAKKGELDPFMVTVMEEIGVDMRKHRPKRFEDLEDDSFDLIITLSPEAQHHAVDMTRTMACDVEFWNTFDPSLAEGNREMRLDAYRQVRDQLVRKIRDRFAAVRTPGN